MGVLKRISKYKTMYALRKKELIASFVKHFTENDENTICTVFQIHIKNEVKRGVLNRMSTMQGHV